MLTLAVWANWSCSGLQYSSKVTTSLAGAGPLAGLFPGVALLHFTTSSCCSRRLGMGKRQGDADILSLLPRLQPWDPRTPLTWPRHRWGLQSLWPRQDPAASPGGWRATAASGPQPVWPRPWVSALPLLLTPSPCTVGWGRNVTVSRHCNNLPTDPHARGNAHLDLLNLPNQLLYFMLQPLVSLLGCLFGTKTLTKLWREEQVWGSSRGSQNTCGTRHPGQGRG